MRTGQQVWTYDSTLDASSKSWVGYDVHATDGRIGTVDEMNTETGRGSLVVDTGFWIFGKKRLLPASSVRSVDHADRTINVALTKDQIKNAPDYDEVRRADSDYYDESERYYGSYV